VELPFQLTEDFSGTGRALVIEGILGVGW